jgi:hypothetical protein
MACFVAPRWRHKAKVNGSTELAELLGPTGSFGRDALRRVLVRGRLQEAFPIKQALKQTRGVCLRAF